MKTNMSKPQRMMLAVAIAGMLAMIAGSALAAIPSTADYLNALQPMLTGRVSSVNEHQVVVETEQDETVVMALDSRSMVPVDIAPGMSARIEFNVMDDGRRLVKRIIPIRSGMNPNRELAYSNERTNGEYMAQYASTSDGEGVGYGPSRASTALSATNQSMGTPLAATPSTNAYLVAMQPMIAGRVVAVNDHRIIVDTDQGQRVALELDSRTIVPVDLKSGMTVRVEYRAMTDGPKYAKRITPIKSSANTDAEFSYVQPAERHEAVAQIAASEPESLPQTAGHQPLIALVGFLAFGAAGAVAIGRRLYAS